jgi:hypothetical protein
MLAQATASQSSSSSGSTAAARCHADHASTLRRVLWETALAAAAGLLGGGVWWDGMGNNATELR